MNLYFHIFCKLNLESVVFSFKISFCFVTKLNKIIKHKNILMNHIHSVGFSRTVTTFFFLSRFDGENVKVSIYLFVAFG